MRLVQGLHCKERSLNKYFSLSFKDILVVTLLSKQQHVKLFAKEASSLAGGTTKQSALG
jgi:hypothetical protein